MTVNYDNPDSDSTGLTYKAGTQLTDGLGFHDIRKINIDNLEKEYNYLLPRCLDLYKKMKYSELNNSSDKSTLENHYLLCSNKLDTLKSKLDEANTLTSGELEILRGKTTIEDRNIFENQQKIDNASNVLKQKQERLNIDITKVDDYKQLINSISTKNIIWFILLLIFIAGFSLLGYFYFSSGEGGEGGEGGPGEE